MLELKFIELAFTSLTAGLGTILAIYRLRSARPRKREKLVRDLEFLKSLNPQSREHELVKTKLEEDIRLVFEGKSYNRETYSRYQIAYCTVGLILLIIFGLWIYWGDDLGRPSMLFYAKSYGALLGFFMIFFALFLPDFIIRQIQHDGPQ